MMDYGASSPGGHANSFQFDTSSPMDQSGFATPSAGNHQQRPALSRHASAADLQLDTGYANNSQAFSSMLPPNSGYDQSPGHATNALDMSMGSPYIDTNMAMNMDYGVDQSLANSLSGDAMMGNVYGQQAYNQPQPLTPMHVPPTASQGTPHSHTHSGRNMTPDHRGNQSVHHQYGGSTASGTPNTSHLQQSRTQSLHVPDMNSPVHGASPLSQPPMAVQSQMSQPQPQQVQPQQLQPQQFQQAQMRGPSNQQQHQSSNAVPTTQQRSSSGQSDAGPPQTQQQHQHSSFDRGTADHVPSSGIPYNPNNQGFAWDTPEGGWPTTMTGRPHMSSVYKNAYSSTGFDMLGVLVSFEKMPSPFISDTVHLDANRNTTQSSNQYRLSRSVLRVRGLRCRERRHAHCVLLGQL